MIPDPTDQSGVRPDNPVVRHDTYRDWPQLDGRVGVCVMAFSDTLCSCVGLARGVNAKSMGVRNSVEVTLI